MLVWWLVGCVGEGGGGGGPDPEGVVFRGGAIQSDGLGTGLDTCRPPQGTTKENEEEWPTAMASLLRVPPWGPRPGGDAYEVLVLQVDLADTHPSGTVPDAVLELPDRFWRENSDGQVGFVMDRFDPLLPLPDRSDALIWPRAETWLRLVVDPGRLAAVPEGESLELAVRDDSGGDHTVRIERKIPPTDTPDDLAWLVKTCQNALAAANLGWMSCQDDGGTLLLAFPDARIAVGTSIALGPAGPSFGPAVGLDRVVSTSGDPTTLEGQPVGGTSDASELMLEARSAAGEIRRFRVALPPTAAGDAAAIESAASAASDAGDGAWLEGFDPAGATDRVGLALRSDLAGPGAAVWVTRGDRLADLGLWGTTRAVGLSASAKSNTLRDGPALTQAAIRAYRDRRLDDGDRLADIHLDLASYDVVAVVLPEIPEARARQQNTWIDLGGAAPPPPPLLLKTVVSFVDTSWEVWSHELGHTMDAFDLYDTDKVSDPRYQSDQAWPARWSVMDDQKLGNHLDGWHKAGWHWLTPVVMPVPPFGTLTDTFVLVPQEWPTGDYRELASEGKLAHLIRIDVGPHHSLFVENRQPGEAFSSALPSRTTGWSWSGTCADAGQPGGVLVTDALDLFELKRGACGSVTCDMRPPVTVLNPAGQSIDGVSCADLKTQARALGPREVLDLGGEGVPIQYRGMEIETRGERTVDDRPPAVVVQVTTAPPPYFDLAIGLAPPPAGFPPLPPQLGPDAAGIWVDAPGGVDYSNWAVPPPAGLIGTRPWCSGDRHVANRVWVRVVNAGTVDADNVEVELREADGPTMRTSTHSVPAHGYADFGFDWSPRCDGRIQLAAQILHADPDDDSLSDVVPDNDFARETLFLVPLPPPPPKPPSPPVFGAALFALPACDGATQTDEQQPAEIEWLLENPRPEPVTVWLLPSGLPEGLDLELDSESVVLAPSATTAVRGRLWADREQIPAVGLSERTCDSSFRLEAWAVVGDTSRLYDATWVEVNPGPPSALDLDAKPAPGRIDLRGTLDGDLPGGAEIGVVAIGESDVATADAVTTSAGAFEATLSGLAPGRWRVIARYEGPDMTPSRSELEVVVDP